MQKKHCYENGKNRFFNLEGKKCFKRCSGGEKLNKIKNLTEKTSLKIKSSSCSSYKSKVYFTGKICIRYKHHSVHDYYKNYAAFRAIISFAFTLQCGAGNN